MFDLPRRQLETRQADHRGLADTQRAGPAARQAGQTPERIRSEEIDPRLDDAFTITADGRLTSETADNFVGLKINALVDRDRHLG